MGSIEALEMEREPIFSPVASNHLKAPGNVFNVLHGTLIPDGSPMLQLDKMCI